MIMAADANPSMACNGIVVEVLNRENYSDWSILVENYLKGNGLWNNIIEEQQQQQKRQQQEEEENTRKKNEEEEEENTRKKKEEWEYKNLRALHAIQLSCGKALGQIRNFKKAKEAWKHLKTSFSEDVKANEAPNQTKSRDVTSTRLQILVKKLFLKEAKLYMDINPRDVFSTSEEDGRTALHVAVATGHVELVKLLAKAGKQRLLRMQDKNGYTALALAAKVTDNKEMAKVMIENGDPEELLTIAAKPERDDDGVDEIPVLLASEKGHKEMTRYLFDKTPLSLLSQNCWEYGVVLLSRCIYNEIFDVALKMLQNPNGREIPLGHSQNKDLRPIYALAHMPDSFRSTGTKLNWWKQFIYDKILSLEEINNEMPLIVTQEPNEERPRIMTHTLPGLGGLLRKLRQFVQTVLLKSSVFQEIYEKKMNHHLVLEILNCLCKRISEMSYHNVYSDDMSSRDGMLQASKNGITEFIESMRAANPELLLAMDASNRGIFAHAILNRQEQVFQLIHYIENKEIFTSCEDILGNNLLHIAAELGPSRYLDRISNAALQMQRELQWFQEVKKVMPKWCHTDKDANGKTPSELFTQEHKELLKSAENWAKETAKSFTLVGTLIITIMFAAAFTVPGGNDQKYGTPIFLGTCGNNEQRTPIFICEDIFNFFIICDAVSLVTSSSSVLMFIGILTSRYSERDFLTNLPLKLLFGLATLFLSVASMMCAFCAALALMLEGYFRIVIAAMWLALLPILVSLPFVLRLTLDIFNSTLRFDRLAPNKKIKETW